MSIKGTANIQRYNPETDKEPYMKKYSFNYQKGMTVLDVLLQIVQEQDESLGFSYCCCNSHCGLCGALVNEKAVLMCREAAEEVLTIKPLANLTVIRDLIIDFDQYEKRILKLRTFLDCQDQPSVEPQPVDMKYNQSFKEASRCVLCLCCISVCPAYRRNYHAFLGPAAYTRVARHFFDPRDQLNRCLIFNQQGLELCISCGRCSKICPHKAGPGDLIDLIKDICQEGKEASIPNEQNK